MAKYTSEEALNHILNMLDYMIVRDEQEKEEQQEVQLGQADKNIVQLLQGIVNTTVKNPDSSAGMQLKALSQGMQNLKNIDANDIKNVTATLTEIGRSMNSLSIKKSSLDSLTTLISFLTTAGLISKANVDGLIYMTSTINEGMINNINNLLNGLSINDGVELQIQKLDNIIKALNNIQPGNILQLKLIADNISPDTVDKINDQFNRLNINDLAIEHIMNLNRALNILSNIAPGNIAAFDVFVDNITLRNIQSLNTALQAIDIDDSSISNSIKLFTALTNLSALQVVPNASLKVFLDNLNINELNDFIRSINGLNIEQSAFKNINDLSILLQSMHNIDPDNIHLFNQLIDNISLIKLDGVNEFISKLNFSDTKFNIAPLINIISELNKIPDVQNLDNKIKFIEINILNSTKLLDFINSINVKNPKDAIVVTKALNELISCFNNIALIDVKNLNDNLAKLDPNAGKRLGDFLNSIIKNIPSDKDTVKMMMHMSQFMKGLSSIIDTGLLNMKISLNPLKGKILGRQIGDFLKAVISAVDKKKIDIQIKGIGELLGALAKFGDKDSHISIFRIRRFINGKNGEMIGAFFNNLVKNIPVGKDTDKAIHEIAELFKALSGITVMQAFAIRRFAGMLGPKEGKAINGFIKELITDIDHIKLKEANVMLKQLPIAMMYIAGSIAVLAGTIALFGIVNTVAALGIISVATTGMYMVIKKLSGIKYKDAKYAESIIQQIGKVTLILTGTLALNALIVSAFPEKTIMASLGIIGVFLTGITLVTLLLSNKTFNANISKAGNVINDISKTILLLSGSMLLLAGVAVLINKVEWDAVKFTIGMFGAVVLSMVLISKLVDNNKADMLAMSKSLFITLAAFTGSLYLMANFIRKYKPGEIVGSVLLFTGFITATILIFKKLANSNKDIKSASIALLAISGFYLLTSVVISKLVIPIGEEILAATLGMTALLLFTGFSVYIANRIGSQKTLKQMQTGIISLAALTLIMFGTSLIIKEILIPIGEKWGRATVGAVLMLSVIGIGALMTDMLVKKMSGNIVKSVAVVGILSFLLLGVSLIIKELLIPIGEQWKEAVKGGAAVIGIMGVFSLLVGAFANFVKPELQAKMASAGILLGGLAIVLSLCIAPAYLFVKLAKQVSQISAKDILATGAIVTSILAVGGGIVALIAASNFVGMGLILAAEGVLAGLALVLTLCMKPAFLFVELSRQVADLKEGTIRQTTASMIAMFTGISAAITILSVQSAVLALAAPLIGITTLAISGIMSTVKKAVDLYSYIDEHLTVKSIQNVNKIITEKDGLIDSITKIVSGLDKISKWAVIKISVVTPALNSIFGTISEFIDVITKVSTMSYISGYDSRGKPIYTKLPASVFSTAAVAVTQSFSTFIKTLADNFNNIKKLADNTIAKMGYCMIPIMHTISKFVDTVIKVATMNIVMGYDNNGKPIYEHVQPDVFNNAAIVVSNNFNKFIVKLGESIDKLSGGQQKAIKQISKVMKPIMKAVSTFVDTIVKLITSTYVSGYDDNGKPIYETIDISEFDRAAEIVSTNFGRFINSMNESFKNIEPSTAKTIKQLGKSLGPIMKGISDYINAIINVSTLMIPDMWDEDGKPIHFIKVNSEEFEIAANNVTASFATFVDALTDQFAGSWWGNKTKRALNAIGENIKPVMEGLMSYTDSILKLATGTYIDHYVKDANGNYIPLYKKIDPEKDFIKAAVYIQVSITKFIDAMIEWSQKSDLVKKGKGVLKMLGESVSPIMEGVSNFSKALQPFLNITKGKPGDIKDKNDYLCLDQNFIRNISKNIAQSFVDFISILSVNLSDKKNRKMYDAAKSAADDIKDVLNSIQKASKSMASVIDSMTKDGKVISNGVEIIEMFNNMSNRLASFVMNTSKMFKMAIEPSKDITAFLKQFTYISKDYGIISGSFDTKNYDNMNLLVKSLETSLNKLSDVAINVSAKVKNIELNKIHEFITSYSDISSNIINLSNMLLRGQNITGGIELFVKNVEMMSNDDLMQKLTTSGNSLINYSNSMKVFTMQISNTNEHLSRYSMTLQKSNDSLNMLDSALIERDVQRVRALNNFTSGINNITESINNMKDSIENMKESINTINFDGLLNKLSGISDMLNTTVTDVNKVLATNAQGNTGNAGVQNQAAGAANSNAANGGNAQVQSVPVIARPEDLFRNATYIEFKFQDKTLRGFAEVHS